MVFFIIYLRNLGYPFAALCIFGEQKKPVDTTCCVDVLINIWQSMLVAEYYNNYKETDTKSVHAWMVIRESNWIFELSALYEYIFDSKTCAYSDTIKTKKEKEVNPMNNNIPKVWTVRVNLFKHVFHIDLIK